MAKRLSSRFGWKSVMWTGWLGVPVHELSHAVFCYIFGHEIREMALFRPDRTSQTLGYVRHSYRRGNLWQEVGNAFIGIAPLIGGGVSLTLLLLLIYPQALAGSLDKLVSPQETLDAAATWAMIEGAISHWLAAIFSLENLWTFQFWLFLYLVVCIGSHMAPSRDDYEGSFRGGLMLLCAMLLIALVLVATFNNPLAMVFRLHLFLMPVHAVLVLALLLCLIATGVVFVLTEVTDHIGLSSHRPKTT